MQQQVILCNMQSDCSYTPKRGACEQKGRGGGGQCGRGAGAGKVSCRNPKASEPGQLGAVPACNALPLQKSKRGQPNTASHFTANIAALCDATQSNLTAGEQTCRDGSHPGPSAGRPQRA